MKDYKWVLRACLESECRSPKGLQIACLLTFFTKYCNISVSLQLDFVFLDYRDEL